MTKAEKILNKCEHILDDYDADYRGGYVDVIDGTTYIVFKYYGGKHDTIDRNDDSWDEMYELEGVADVGYGSGYGMDNTKYEDMLLIELEDGLNESKNSARKSIKEERYNVELSDYSGSIVDEETFDKKSDAIQWAKDNGRNCYARIWDNEEGKTVKEWKVKSIKESADDINNTAYFDRVAGELHSWYVCYVEDYERKYEYGFKNEKECINWIKKNGFDLDPSMIESKNSTRKSIKESVPFTKITWYDDFLSQEMANLIRDKFDVSVSYFSDFDEGVYGIRIKTSDYNSKILNFIKKKVGDVSVLEESKKSARNSIKESLNFKKDYAVEVMGGSLWFKPFYWDFDKFRDDLLIASEEEEFTYYITEATTESYRINLESNDGFYERYDITFRIIPKSDKATAKELNDYLN